MIIPVKCFTCGTVLGDKYQYYCKEVRTRKKKKKYVVRRCNIFDKRKYGKNSRRISIGFNWT